LAAGRGRLGSSRGWKSLVVIVVVVLVVTRLVRAEKTIGSVKGGEAMDPIDRW
jgi:hypothetical protein